MNIKLINTVIDSYGGILEVQKRFGYKSSMAVYQWRRQGIPKKYIADIHIDTGISIRRLKKCVA